MRRFSFAPVYAPVFALMLGLGCAGAAFAQFTGVRTDGLTTAAEASEARVNTYVTLEGNIRSHLREDYYVFGDDSGELRAEIEPAVFEGRAVAPETRVRLRGEVDLSLSGRYVWVYGLEVLD